MAQRVLGLAALSSAYTPKTPHSACTWRARHAGGLIDTDNRPLYQTWQNAVNDCDSQNCWAISQKPGGEFQTHDLEEFQTIKLRGATMSSFLKVALVEREGERILEETRNLYGTSVFLKSKTMKADGLVLLHLHPSLLF